jgi:hypothetical protein
MLAQSLIKLVTHRLLCRVLSPCHGITSLPRTPASPTKSSPKSRLLFSHASRLHTFIAIPSAPARPSSPSRHRSTRPWIHKSHCLLRTRFCPRRPPTRRDNDAGSARTRGCRGRGSVCIALWVKVSKVQDQCRTVWIVLWDKGDIPPSYCCWYHALSLRTFCGSWCCCCCPPNIWSKKPNWKDEEMNQALRIARKERKRGMVAV